MRLWGALVALLCISGCNNRQQILLKYQLAIDPNAVYTVETAIGVDPNDPRAFFADQPFRTVATGVGYEVVSGGDGQKRVMKLSQEAALGFKFSSEFGFTLLPPADGEAPPLSIVARALGPSRNPLGETQALAAAFGPGTELVVHIDDQRCGGEACAADQLCCNKKCLRVDEDATNCGACGKTCGMSETCSGSQCRCAGGSGCTTGNTCCGDGCANLQTDRFNCGACGKRCNTGESCVAGACQCPGAPSNGACGPGGLCCPGTGCSVNGKCPCGIEMCTNTQICCGGIGMMGCKNFLVDGMNCGMCGTTCMNQLMCSGGSCKCQGVTCSGSDACCGTGCKNLQNDVANCGSCGKSCVMGEVCNGGTCKCGTTTCASDEICCGGSCKKAQTDEKNCGFCNNQCGSNEMCSGGTCQCAGGPGCTGNEKCCPNVPTAGDHCFDVTSDPQNCGGCGVMCGPLESCIQGMCMVTQCAPECTARGNQCVGGVCTCPGQTPPCGGCTPPPCGDPLSCCTTGCKNLKTDTLNCGSCGKPCVGAELCCNGTCTPQGTPNCGACGRICGGGQQCCSVGAGVWMCRPGGCTSTTPDMGGFPDFGGAPDFGGGQDFGTGVGFDM
jgi:hypothetical protein